MAEWQAENTRLFRDPQARTRWSARYAGQNQAALGCLLERGVPQALGVRLAQLPCAEWNCEDSSWPRFNPRVTRILHVKSQLHRELFRKVSQRPDLRPLVDCWRAREAEARSSAGR